MKEETMAGNRNNSVVDSLGNRFRKGQLVLAQLTNMPMMAQVVEVVPPPHIEVAGGVAPTTGRLVLQIIVPVVLRSGESVDGVWVLEQPPEPLAQ